MSRGFLLLLVVGAVLLLQGGVQAQPVGRPADLTSPLSNWAPAINILGHVELEQMINNILVQNDTVTLQIVNPAQLAGQLYQFQLQTPLGVVRVNVHVEPSRYVIRLTPTELVAERSQVYTHNICDGDPVLDSSTYTSLVNNPGSVPNTPLAPDPNQFNSEAAMGWNLDAVQPPRAASKFHTEAQPTAARDKTAKSVAKIDPRRPASDQTPEEFLDRLRALAKGHRRALKTIQKLKSGLYTQGASNEVHHPALLSSHDVHPTVAKRRQQKLTLSAVHQALNGGTDFALESDTSLQYETNPGSLSAPSAAITPADVSAAITADVQDTSGTVKGDQINCALAINAYAESVGHAFSPTDIWDTLTTFKNYQLSVSGKKSAPSGFCAFAPNQLSGAPADSEGISCTPLGLGFVPLSSTDLDSLSQLTEKEFYSSSWPSLLQGVNYTLGSTSVQYDGVYFESEVDCPCSARNRTYYRTCALNPWVVAHGGPGGTPLAGVVQKCVRAGTQFMCQPVTQGYLQRDLSPEITYTLSGCDASDHASSAFSCAGHVLSFGLDSGSCSGCTEIDLVAEADAVRAYEYEQDTSNNRDMALGLQTMFNALNATLYANQGVFDVANQIIGKINNLTNTRNSEAADIRGWEQRNLDGVNSQISELTRLVNNMQSTSAGVTATFAEIQSQTQSLQLSIGQLRQESQTLFALTNQSLQLQAQAETNMQQQNLALANMLSQAHLQSLQVQCGRAAPSPYTPTPL